MQLLFLAVYIADMVGKLVGMGKRAYFSDPWNKMDCFVMLSGVIGEFIQIFSARLTIFILLRPVRILRLLKFRRSYQV